MKTYIKILSMLSVMGILSACGKNGEDTGGDLQQTSVETQQPQTETSQAQDGETAAEIYLRDVPVEEYLNLNGTYMGMTLQIAPKAEVADGQADELALTAYNNSAGLTAADGITERAVAVGDLINLDYSGKKDGVVFDGGTAENQQLGIGSGTFIDGFEEGLVGVMPGETVDLQLTFPETYGNAELAGQPVVFTVKVNFIYPFSTEQMKDEKIAEMTGGEYTTVADFVQYCQDYLEYEAQYNYDVARENAVIDGLEESFSVESVPKELQDKYALNVRNSLADDAARNGLDADTYCYYMYQMDAASYVEKFAETSARQSMMFQYVANQEGLNVSDEELEADLQRFAEENGVASVEEMLQTTDREEFREYFMFQNVVDFIVENAQVTEQ